MLGRSLSFETLTMASDSANKALGFRALKNSHGTPEDLKCVVSKFQTLTLVQCNRQRTATPEVDYGEYT